MTEREPLTGAELDALDGWWRAANYLSVGQSYLMGNPLLAEPLRPEHVKPRLLGHTREHGEDAPEINDWKWAY